ncbi:unnamed protein product, partial [Mesorhabditis belari]|uniref:UPAR/Ly6 domain-containing protein n=1 Tax=Mesorhabditis belari TaxID=2138241 RepID=A0AAF3FKH8_9BILA
MNRFIFLFFLTVTSSLAVQCYSDVNVGGLSHTGQQKKIDCGSSCKYCLTTMAFTTDPQGSANQTFWDCGCSDPKNIVCTDAGRTSNEGYGPGGIYYKEENICCRGELCNGNQQKTLGFVVGLMIFSIIKNIL